MCVNRIRGMVGMVVEQFNITGPSSIKDIQIYAKYEPCNGLAHHRLPVAQW